MSTSHYGVCGLQEGNGECYPLIIQAPNYLFAKKRDRIGAALTDQLDMRRRFRGNHLSNKESNAEEDARLGVPEVGGSGSVGEQSR